MQKHMKMAFTIRTLPFFSSMSEELLARIENYVYHRDYEARQVVYFPDDPRDNVYWVRKGRVRVTRVAGDGRELTFRHLLPGDMFGEECLLGEGRCSSYAEAMAASVLCIMRADDFRRLCRDETEMAMEVSRWLCQRVADVEQVLAENVFKTVRGRIASSLLRLSKRAASDNGTIQITHHEIASMVGSTRETTTAVLHGFRKEGIIELANRRLTLVDLGGLERAARSG